MAKNKPKINAVQNTSNSTKGGQMTPSSSANIINFPVRRPALIDDKPKNSQAKPPAEKR
jgi:hypothetical protein